MAETPYQTRRTPVIPPRPPLADPKNATPYDVGTVRTPAGRGSTLESGRKIEEGGNG